jgi:hypothetical protein
MTKALLASLALSFGLAAPSGAVVLTTPDLEVGSQQAVTCALTNIDTKPVTVTAVGLVGETGVDVIPGFDSCTGIAALGPRATCLVRAPTGQDAYCSFDVKGSKVRAAGIVRESGAPFTVEHTVPATK